MRVKRFTASDIRSAMAQIKDELGADAVILSNRKVDGQVEILAALDYDEHLINDALDHSLIRSRPNSAAAHYETAAAKEPDAYPSTADILRQREEKAQQQKQMQQEEQDKQQAPEELASQSSSAQVDAAQEEKFESVVGEMKAAVNHQAAGLFQSMASNTSGMEEMRGELKSLRALLENQQTLGEWGALARQHPLRISLYKRFTEMGLSQDVCKYLVKGLDDLEDVDQAMQAALKQLVHQLPITDDDILNQGGVIAMVGPTGVGKTTTIAKIAARFTMRHGARHVALISTDNYRIGAHEQLMTYGRLLGVSVHTANSGDDLQQLLHKLYDKKLILIDTAGMSQRDVQLSEQFVSMGKAASLIKTYLVLSANAQLPTLDESIRLFKKANLAGCILTKLDEAVSLGGVLSAMIKHHLPAAYVSSGQKVPEDLQAARARELVDEAISHMKRYRENTDDDFMAVSFARGVEPAHL